jgi:hypothetical protein
MKLTRLIAGAALIALNSAASAYSVFPIDGTQSLKWGSNVNGTPGGVISWSFIPIGTSGSAYCGSACPGGSVGSLNIENSPGTGYTLTSLTSLESYIDAAFSKWAAVADITFVKLGIPDSGVAINDPAAVPNATGNIRIGVFNFSGGGGAVGFAPPPNGGTGAGDILFDANSFYAFQPGVDGNAFPGTSTAPNDFESLLLHEMGHALGLAHPVYDGTCPVMQIDAACLFKINRQLDADDIAGAQFLYGAPVPEPETYAMFFAGLGLVAWAARRRNA